jgi:hypothetical protein
VIVCPVLNAWFPTVCHHFSNAFPLLMADRCWLNTVALSKSKGRGS